ncbi:E3 ubiquitin-protein ligase TRIM39-like isoform X1 [Ictalurus furcatus]|uniref:E3 ubiquitin-protein ligase TRIM39-like isoform X1 n=1 Tax=Ictalurus furcatus TaxID=66913 RepID=UPI00234FE721|nr:E3 ubiquitin-protein ligase TRIM39-like isoform X1 [Ictalurus furcatus]XP_053485467.1 E3 ubiquitin-protein ligase TRIM39-like isoform X1 [Ictalurus furcatus]
MLGRCSDLNHAAKEGGNQQNDAFSQDKYKSTTAQVQNTEVSAADWVTLRRRTLIGAVTVSALIILALLGGIVITAHRLMEVLDQLNTVSDVTKEFPSLSRKEGIVPEEVWRWIVAAKAAMTLNPQSAHELLSVSSDGKRLYQASSSSPPRVSTTETYVWCLCVASKNLLNTRAYFELEVTQSVPWTLGLHTESFNADNTPDTHPERGIWTIRSAESKIIINDGKATPTPYATPAKLGLYLDYARGQVSFYNSVARLHLHTYLTSFKEKLRFYAAVRVGINETQEALISFV